MTYRVTLGIDPGMQGAIAILLDGEPSGFLDLPITKHPRKGNRLDCQRLQSVLRGLCHKHQGAHRFACIEETSIRGHDARGNAQRIGEGYGMLLASLVAAGIEYVEVRPQEWKRCHGFIRMGKDEPRQAAIVRWPETVSALSRKKDQGRADALYIARWAFETEAWI